MIRAILPVLWRDPRLQLVGLGTETSFPCHLSQHALSDALGLTAIHLNRMLRELRERGLATFQRGEVRIHDLPRLRLLADHHGGYLDQAKPILG